MRSFLAALAFLTIVPVPIKPFSEEELARSRYWYPVVGLLFGVFLGGCLALTACTGAPLLAAFLVLGAWVLATGALHVDGFCDLCDGLFGGDTPAQRLQIMQDPHVGAFGVVGAILLLLGKWVLLAEMLARYGKYAPWALAATACVARCLVLVMAGTGTYARPKGTGKILIEATTPWQAGVFALVGCAASLAILFRAGMLVALAPFLAALLVVLALAQLCRRRLGGITGDCLGAAIEAAEFAFLLAAVLVRFGS